MTASYSYTQLTSQYPDRTDASEPFGGWVANVRGRPSTATVLLGRFGSTARGDRAYRAGHALGQLLRAVYLCDYFTLPDFRRSVYRVLERGESVHTLQRQI